MTLVCRIIRALCGGDGAEPWTYASVSHARQRTGGQTEDRRPSRAFFTERRLRPLAQIADQTKQVTRFREVLRQQAQQSEATR